MGTRGLFGFYCKGKFFVVYNHWDSYPTGLGKQVVDQLKKTIQSGQFEEWFVLLEKLKIVKEHVPPTPQDIERLKPYTDLSVSNRLSTTQWTSDWYCLLRGCQGSLEKVLQSGYLINNVNDNEVPYWQEYAYVVNMDTRKLDFYAGEDLVNSYEFTNLPNWTDDNDDDDDD